MHSRLDVAVDRRLSDFRLPTQRDASRDVRTFSTLAMEGDLRAPFRSVLSPMMIIFGILLKKHVSA